MSFRRENDINTPFYIYTMSSYIHPDNQEILWNIVNGNAILADSFSTYTPEQKDDWFKSIIELFYKKVGDTILSKAQLHQLNKDTLAYMIQLSHRSEYSLQKEKNQALLNKPSPSFPDPAIQNLHIDNVANAHMQNIYTHSFSQSNREDMFTQQFQEREKQYKSMIEVKAPESIDFREKVEDTAISNMEELIKQHQQEREKEWQIFRPKIVVPSQQQPVIRETSPPTIPSEQMMEPVNSVSTTNVESINSSPEKLSAEEIQRLKTRVKELSEDISIFSNELDKIKHILEKTI